MMHELRMYHAMPGRLPDLNKRFETITLKLWEKHGIRQVGFWTFNVGGRTNDLWYILEWKDMAERDKLWNQFQNDPEWQTARAKTEENGPLLRYVENAFLAPTSYSKMK
ncbi:MAG TPA: NIPSNAP family protein [bacterium]